MKLCVCTVVVGDRIKRIARHTVPAMEAYSNRIGAAFIVLKKSVLSESHFRASYEKLRIRDLLDSYDRVLFVDADVLILPSAGNVFDLTPSTALGVTIVGDLLPGIKTELRSIEKIFDYRLNTDQYFNSGVLVASKAQQDLFEFDHPDSVLWATSRYKRTVKGYNDQSLLNYRAQKLQLALHDLGPCYNYTRVWGEFAQRFSKKFIHYAGIKNRRDLLIRKDAEIAGNPLAMLALTHFASLSRLRDQYLRSRGFQVTRGNQ